MFMIQRSLDLNLSCKASIVASSVLSLLCQVVVACMSFIPPSEFVSITSDPSVLHPPCSGYMWRTSQIACIFGILTKCIHAVCESSASLSLSCTRTTDSHMTPVLPQSDKEFSHKAWIVPVLHHAASCIVSCAVSISTMHRSDWQGRCFAAVGFLYFVFICDEKN